MASIPQDPKQTNDSNSNNIIILPGNLDSNKNENSNSNQPTSKNENLNKSHQLSQKDNRLNKMNINSSLNIPSANTATNISLNEQILYQKRDHSDYFDNDISYHDDEENDPILKEYTMINERKNKAMDDLKNINERIKNNNKKIEELKKNLIDLKEEKNKKQIDIMNLLSNKESIEEIYKNQIYSLNSNNNSNSINNLNDNGTLNNDINNLINISIKNDINDNSAIHLNSNHNITIDNEILNNDEDNFKIAFNEIKESDQKKYIEQVTNMFEDIFKKKDEKINSLIANIINNAYELFVNNISDENDNENNSDIIVNNFFGKVSLFISNHSLGKYPESKINLFLRYLLKINSINVKLTKYIKFVNKKYKDKKKELNDMINFLEKKNINLNEKNNRLEMNMQEYDDKLEFFGQNEVFDIEQKSEDSDEGIFDNDNKDKKNKRKKIIKNRNKKDENEEQLSHDVVIEYEDGIDQNVEINYEEDDIANEYDYEKENEMIKKGLNPYNNNELNNQNNKFNEKRNSGKNKQNNKNNNKQIIVNDNDESDKSLNEFIQGKNDKNSENNNLNENKVNKNNRRINRRNKENNKQIMQNQTNDDYQLAKKINYNNKIRTSSTATNLISDYRLYPTPQPRGKNDEDLENQLTAKEIEHYNRVQRIMNAGPKVNNIFGVNNYNPENSMYGPYDINNIFSPKKNNGPNSNNKIDKTIRIGSRQNHNFISIINKTKNVTVKKKNAKDRTKNKDKSKIKDNGENNEGVIKVINLEENFLNEIKSEEKIDNENQNEGKKDKEKEKEKEKENVINQTNNNNRNRRKNSIEINKNKDKDLPKSNVNQEEKNLNKNKIEVQGYYLNIINSKQTNKEKDEKDNPKNNNNKKEEDNLKNKNENSESSTNNKRKAMKVTKSRELNINELKNNKIGIINKKIITKTQIPKNGEKEKNKIFLLNPVENKDSQPLTNSLTRYKTNNSLNKPINQRKISNIITDRSNTNNNSNINIPTSKRSYSISETNQNKIEENKNKSYNNTKTFVVNNNNVNISPNIIKSRKISNIPLDKNKKQYNSNTYEGNFKREAKAENIYVNNKRK